MSGPARPQEPRSENWLSLSAGIASVTVAFILVALKLWAVMATGALSVAASLADSAADLFMSLAAAAAIVYAARPADEDHTFGHTAVEDLTALAQSLVVAASALFIGLSGLRRLVSPEAGQLESEELGTWVMGISIVLTLLLVLWQGFVAKRTGNRVVAADRMHYIGDLLPALGAILALQASQQYGIRGLDSWIALGAAIYMFQGAFRIGKAAWDALMDRAPDPALVADIGRLAQSWPGVRGFHDLKTRSAGSRIFVNLHIELDGDQTLSQAHAIGASLRREILTKWPNTDVIIHKDVASD